MNHCVFIDVGTYSMLVRHNYFYYFFFNFNDSSYCLFGAKIKIKVRNSNHKLKNLSIVTVFFLNGSIFRNDLFKF